MPFHISDDSADLDEDSPGDDQSASEDTEELERYEPLSDDTPDFGTFRFGLNVQKKYQEVVDKFNDDHGKTGTQPLGSNKEGDRGFILWDENAYLFHLQGEEPRKLTFEEVQACAAWYPYEGQRLTMRSVTKQLYKEFGIKMQRDEFRRIKTVLGLEKSSMPVAPHILAQDEVPMEDKVDLMFEQKEAQIEIAQQAKRDKEWRKRFEKKNKQLHNIEHFIRDALNRRANKGVGYEVPEPDFDETLDPYAQIVFLADWHVGKQTDVENNTFNREILDTRLRRLIEGLYAKLTATTTPIDDIHVALGGDFIDGPGGDMHPQQHLRQDIHNTEQCLVAADAIAEVVNFLDETFAANIHVHAVPGNHGRTRKDHHEDPYRLAETLTYELARNQSAGDWHVAHRDTMQMFQIGGTGVYLQHGDDIPTDLRDLVWANEKKGIDQYLVLTGHKHAFQVSGHEDRNVMHVRSSSLCGGSQFSTRQLGTLTRPSQTIISVYDDGPQTVDLVYLDTDYTTDENHSR